MSLVSDLLENRVYAVITEWKICAISWPLRCTAWGYIIMVG